MTSTFDGLIGICDIRMVLSNRIERYWKVNTGSPARAKALVAELARRDVFIHMPGAPPLDRCIRVTVGTAEERATFVDILRATLPAVADMENR